MNYRLTKHFSFEMAHALSGYEGKCRNLHGHSYKLAVTVEGAPQSQDDLFVMDFAQLKQVVSEAIINKFDHAVVLSETSPLAAKLKGEPNLITLPFEPTTERLLAHFATLLDGKIPQPARLYSLRLDETESSSAEILL